MLESILVASIAGGLGIVLTFIFTRNREVNTMAHQVIASTNTYFNVIETLKTVAFVQAQRIDEWESWGRESKQAWDGLRRKFDGQVEVELQGLPPMPELHLDLREYWREIDQQITDMSKPRNGKH